MLGGGHGPAIPEPPTLSLHVQITVTSLTYQPLFPSVPAVMFPSSEGGVLSTLMPLTVALVLLPAISSAVPVTLWFAPSPSIADMGLAAMPDSASLTAKTT